MIGFNGGLIGVARDTQGYPSKPGIWTPGEQVLLERSGRWAIYPALLLRADGENNSTNIVDDSRNQHVITVNGNAVISTAQSKYGGSSIALDGSGDFLTAPVSSVFDFQANDFTIECWFYVNNLSAVRTIYCLINGTTAVRGLAFRIATDGTIAAIYYNSTSGPLFIVSHQTSLLINEWNHGAVVRKNNVFNVYLNGIKSASSATSTLSLFPPEATRLPTVGRWTGFSNRDFAGFIDDFRIINGFALYDSDFTPPGPL